MSCGNCTNACCCGESITGLRGGIHPDYIESEFCDISIADSSVATYANDVIIGEPIHLVSATICLARVQRGSVSTPPTDAELRKQTEVLGHTSGIIERADTPTMVSLFTIPQWSADQYDKGGIEPHPDSEDGRRYIATCALNSRGETNWTLPPELFGYFCDGGLFVEMNAAKEDFAVRVVVNFVKRAAFPPAYRDPVATLQHYWKCAHGEEREFLDGFYGGVSFNTVTETSGFEPSPGSPVGSNPLDTSFTSPSSALQL